MIRFLNFCPNALNFSEEFALQCGRGRVFFDVIANYKENCGFAVCECCVCVSVVYECCVYECCVYECCE